MSTNAGKRYAQAAFELALERQELDNWQAGLDKIADLAKDSKLMALLENPRLPFAAKKTILQEQLGDVIPLALNLSCLLVSRGRLNLANNIFQEYQRLLDAHRGIEHAEVVTALPLGDEDRQMVSRRLGHMGDLLVDDSIRYRLDLLKKTLAGE